MAAPDIRRVAAAWTPFGAPDFLDLWWEAHGQSLVSPNDLTGHPYLQKVFCLGPHGIVRCAGSGIADYTELNWQAVTEADVSEFLENAHRDAHLILMPRVIEHSRLHRLITSSALPVYGCYYDCAPFVGVHSEWEAYYAQRRGKLRHNLSRAERKLDGMGGLDFVHVTTPDGIRNHIHDAFSIYERRAQGRYRGKFWLTPMGRRFLTRLAVRFAELGSMDLTFLRVAGEPVAFCYGLRGGSDYYFWATAFNGDPRYSPWSPGVLLVKHLLERAFHAGLERFDFMLGDEPYKQTWATGNRNVWTYVIGGRRLPSRLLYLLYSQALWLRQAIRKSPVARMAAEKLLHVHSSSVRH